MSSKQLPHSKYKREVVGGRARGLGAEEREEFDIVKIISWVCGMFCQWCCGSTHCSVAWVMIQTVSFSAKLGRNHRLLAGRLVHGAAQKLWLNRWQMTAQTYSQCPVAHSHPTSITRRSHSLGPGRPAHSFCQPRRRAPMRHFGKYQLCVFKLSWTF